MPGIDLTTLSSPELRKLLKLAHARHDGALADRLEWEIASRGTGSGHVGFTIPHPPVDDPDEPAFHSLASDDEPFVLEPSAKGPEPARSGLILVGLGLVAGFLVTAAAYWGLSGQVLPRRDPPVAAHGAPPGTTARTASATAQPAAPPAPASPHGLEPAPETALAEATAEAAVVAGVDASAREPSPLARRPEARRRTEARRKPDPARPTPVSTCATSPIAADRMICSDLTLAGLHREMQEAYIHALNVRADPTVTGREQTAWRQARDDVSDPHRLAQLYDRRIRELNAAAAEARARREDPPF